MLTTRNQSQVSISGLTYNNLLQDTYNALRDSDAFRKNFSEFTSNTAERMITELYAYIATQLANRLDQMGNELFVDTASASGMSRLLKLVGAKVDFPSAANTYVNVTTSSKTNPLSFTTGIDNGTTELNYTSNAFKSVTASNGTNWEFINYVISEDDGEYVFDYTTKYSFTAPSQIYQVYEGKTQSLEYTVRSINTDIITLTGSPVIKNSVRIYYKQKVMNAGTSNAYEIAEFKKVDNFFTTEALTAKTGIFTVRNLGNGKCEITIKPHYDEATQSSDLGKELLIMYRVGGGSVGNISIGAIDRTERFTTIGGTNNIDVGYGLLNIYNTKAGSGGLDELTTDQIRATVINEVRNTKIAVTEEDYEYLFPKYDSEIALIKCYGEKQDDIADLSETYGYYVNPLNVWLLILKYNKEFYDAYLADTTGITSRINDIAFSILDINPRFNEKYQVNAAFLNQRYESIVLPQYFVETSSTYNLPIDPEGVKLLSNGGCYITVTSHPYVESSSPGRRGVNAFRRYSSDVKDTISWEELLALTSAEAGDTYIISTVDGSGSDEIYSRWTCKETFSDVTVTEDNYSDYWEKVKFDYIYSNLINSPATSSDDIMYVVQDNTDVTKFEPVYSYLDGSFTGNWNKLLENVNWSYETEEHVRVVKFPVNTEIDINGNGIMVEKDTEFANVNDFCDFLNAHADPSTYMVILKENISTSIGVNDYDITNVSIDHHINYNPSGTVTLVVEQNGVTTNIDVDVASVTNYGQLVEAINDRIDALNLTDKYHVGLYNANDCWNLVIISSEEFTYEDFGSELSNHSSLYVYYLNNDAPSYWPLVAEFTVLSPDYTDMWSDYLTKNSQNDIAKVSDGNIVLMFDDNGNCSLRIPYDDAIHQPIKDMFNLEGQEASTVANYRRITVSYVKSSSGDTASIRITTQSNSDIIDVPVYINIFSASNGRIRLGEYYENIEEYLTGVPDVVLDLLKRDRIKNLYSTNYINEGVFASVDKYGSNYKLKFSSKLVGQETYNQLSASLAPAYVITAKSSTDTMPYYTEGNYFYLKVDNINYEGGVEIEPIPRSGIKYVVPQENGYAKFDLSWFNSTSIYNFASTLAYTLSELGPIVDGQPTPLLMVTNYGEGDFVKIYTVSSAYYSSIDFGNTASTTLSTIFGINDSIIYSEEGEIDVEQIKYKYLSLTNSLAINQSIGIKVTNAGGEVISDSVSVGYSLLDFIGNMSTSNVKDYVSVDNGRIVFTELTNNASIEFTLDWYSKFQHDSWVNMFTPESWSNFVETQTYEKTEDVTIVSGKTYYTYDEATGTYNAVANPVISDIDNYYEAVYPGHAVCTLLNKGDYYIDLEVVQDEEGNNINQFWFTVQNTASFPYGDIYFHMYEDYSNDHIVKETEDDVVYTDEYNWNRLMTDKRVMLTEHVYKQPRFVPFDLGITCYLPNSESFSQIDYYTEISNFLREQYGIYANNIGVEILPDNIIFNIKDHFSKVVKVVIDYLGYDISNQKTNQYSLVTDFNQIHILSSSVREQGMTTDPETGRITIEDEVLKHGLDLKIKYRSA